MKYTLYNHSFLSGDETILGFFEFSNGALRYRRQRQEKIPSLNFEVDSINIIGFKEHSKVIGFEGANGGRLKKFNE